MKWLILAALSLAAPNVFAFSLGCTTATEAYKDVFVDEKGTPSVEQIDRLCVCKSRVHFDLRNTETQKTKKITYKISSVYKGKLADDEIIWLAVNGEGEWMVGERNFTLEKRDAFSTELLDLKGRMARGIIFRGDFEAERTPCTK